MKPRLSDTLVDQNGAKSTTDVATARQLITSEPVRKIVSSQFGKDLPPVSVAAISSTAVVAISAISTDPHLAAAVADAYATGFIEFRRQQDVEDLTAVSNKYREQITGLQDQLYFIGVTQASGATSAPGTESRKVELTTQINSLQSQINQLALDASLRTGGAQMVSSAPVPTSPLGAKRIRSVGVALIVGLLYGLVLAFGLEYIDDRIRSKDQLEAATSGLPMLGLIPAVLDWKDHSLPRLVTLEAPRSQIAEAYRSLRTSVQFLSVSEPVSIVHVTSAEPGEGKSTTVANLGVTLADAGLRVVLVDFDLRRPRLHKFFELENEVGIVNVVRGEVSLLDAIHWLDTERYGRLAVLPAGPVPTNPSELTGMPRVRTILEELTAMSDIVILDSAPVMPVTDTLVLSAYVDATVLVARVGVTSGRTIGRANELLQRVGARVAGTVLNAAEPEPGYYGSYRYRYRRGYYYSGYRNSGYYSSPEISDVPAESSRRKKAKSVVETQSVASTDTGSDATLT